MGDGGSDEAAGDDFARNVNVKANSYRDYSPPKAEPKSEFTTTDCDGDASDDCALVGIDDYYCDYRPPKKEVEPEFVNVSGHPIKQEPKPEPDGGDGGASDDYAPNVSTDDCCYDYDSLKKEPKQELATTDGSDDCYHGGDPPKDEPEFVAVGDDTSADGVQDVGYDCSHCGVNLSTREFKVEHELRCKAQIQRRELESQVTEVYPCIYCKCPFLNKEFKEQHQQRWCRKRPVAARKRSNETYSKCDKCEFVTKWKGNLERHLLTHDKNNAEWFACAQCSYKTIHKSDMTEHMKIHGNNFSCCCTICGKSFRKKQCLDDHLLKQHSNESEEVSKLITSKVYTCDICDQFRTSKKSSFNQHVTVTHLKSAGCQKYECPQCPYSTFRKGDLTNHSKTHLEQKDYRCAVCKKQFTRIYEFNSHVLCNHADSVELMKTITSKIHCCKLCSFKTLQKNKLRTHVQSKHI